MSDILVQEHEGCDKCTVAVRSQPGRDVELIDRYSGRVLMRMLITSAEGCWIADALRRAADHARSGIS